MSNCICGACCERQCACPNADWETVDEKRLKAELERAKEALIFEWAKSAEGCWLGDVVNVRHEAVERYKREVGYE